MERWTKYRHLIVPGQRDELTDEDVWHGLIVTFDLVVDGDDRHIAGERAIESFTTVGSRDFALARALARVGELTAPPAPAGLGMTAAELSALIEASELKVGQVAGRAHMDGRLIRRMLKGENEIDEHDAARLRKVLVKETPNG